VQCHQSSQSKLFVPDWREKIGSYGRRYFWLFFLFFCFVCTSANFEIIEILKDTKIELCDNLGISKLPNLTTKKKKRQVKGLHGKHPTTTLCVDKHHKIAI
jgi:hypothetical protein